MINGKGDDSIVVCKSTGVIQHYYNPDASPDLIDAARPSLGLTQAKVTQDGGWLICEFTRVKQFPAARKRRDAASNFFDLNNPFFILAAFGSFDGSSGSINKHDDKIPSSKTANFKTLEIIDGTANYAKYKAHGMLKPRSF